MDDALCTSPQSSPFPTATSHQSKGAISYESYSTLAFLFFTPSPFHSLTTCLAGPEVYEFKTLVCQSLSLIMEKDMATHSSIPAWEIPWTEEPGELQSIYSQRVKHDWVTEHTQKHTHVPLAENDKSVKRQVETQDASWRLPWELPCCHFSQSIGQIGHRDNDFINGTGLRSSPLSGKDCKVTWTKGAYVLPVQERHREWKEEIQYAT